MRVMRRVMRRVMTPLALAPLLGFILLGLSACAVEYDDEVEDIDTAFYDTGAGSANDDGTPWDPNAAAAPLGSNGHGVGAGSDTGEVSESFQDVKGQHVGGPIPLPWWWMPPEDGERDDQGNGEHEPKP